MPIRVNTIPATADRFPSKPDVTKTRRAAAYARVSTDHDDQLTSYESQVEYYTEYIRSRGDLEFAGIYTDEGISGTSTEHREGFKQMISDALDGKIDLIITKSVSRFARNTVDSLSAIRILKEHNVECYFEKENIRTFDSRGELLLSIMASLAQEESRSISENCTWGQRKRFADGKVTVPFSRFLGYDRGEDGNLVVNEKEAELVRKIYELFLRGETPYSIAKLLTEDKIPTPGGKEKWRMSVIESILTNEKYKGDALLQKVFTVDFLTKKKKINEGEVPQYYVEGNHEAIIPTDIYEMVQTEFERRRLSNTRSIKAQLFSDKIVCGVCGGFYCSKVWYSTNKYRKVIWQCRQTFDNERKCATPFLVEDEVKLLFLNALNKRLGIDEPPELVGFSETLWSDLVDHVTVYDRTNLYVVFRDGAKIGENIEDIEDPFINLRKIDN